MTEIFLVKTVKIRNVSNVSFMRGLDDGLSVRVIRRLAFFLKCCKTRNEKSLARKIKVERLRDKDVKHDF